MGAAANVDTGRTGPATGSPLPRILRTITPIVPRTRRRTMTAYFVFPEGGTPAGTRIEGVGGRLGLIFEGTSRSRKLPRRRRPVGNRALTGEYRVLPARSHAGA